MNLAQAVDLAWFCQYFLAPYLERARSPDGVGERRRRGRGGAEKGRERAASSASRTIDTRSIPK